MKELTIEQKAQRYDEVLKAAVVAHKDEDKHLKATLERIFPELAESEDERIRKALIDGFTVMKESKNCGKTFSNHNIPVTDILAWLEKQGDNINCIYDKELSELLHIVICRYVNDPDISYIERENVSKKIFPYVELLEKQGKQKSTNNQFTPEQASILDRHIDKFLEQKPAWSEDDERMYRGLHNLIYSTPYCDSRKELSDWLKSLKDRVQHQKQWKPTEEQIRRLEYFLKLWGKTDDIENTKVFETVKSLLNDLKQL